MDRLKRVSRADLKSPLKAFKQSGGNGKSGLSASMETQETGKAGTAETQGTTASDYETPIYETKRRSVVSLGWVAVSS